MPKRKGKSKQFDIQKIGVADEAYSFTSWAGTLGDTLIPV